MAILDSPFTPDSPARPEMFTGRKEQMEQLDRLARQAAARKRVHLAFVRGERGIGKSSLMHKIITGLGQEFIGAYVNLGGVNTLEEAIKATWEAVVHNSHGTRWWDGIKKTFAAVGIQANANIFGVDFNLSKDKAKADKAGLLKKTNFAHFLGGLAKSIPQCKGLVIVWDDINGLAEKPEFAHWLKSFLDGIASAPVLLALAGLEERRQTIIRHNKSADRIFHLIDISPWQNKETETFLLQGLEKGKFSAIFLPETKPNIIAASKLCYGYPLLAQEFGNALWWQFAKQRNEGKKIYPLDVRAGFRLAAENIGNKWLQSKIIEGLKSENYVRLLGLLPKIVKVAVEGIVFSRADFIKTLPQGITKKVMDNFLQRMQNLNALKKGRLNQQGEYAFHNAMHYMYLCNLSPEVRKMEEKYRDSSKTLSPASGGNKR